MEMEKIVITLLVLIGTALATTVTDKALGIDFSSVEFPRKLVHDFVYKLAGAAIAATIWFL